MKKEYADKWVEALRSGNYKQGRSQLRTPDNTFCCLGVICDLVDNSKWNSGDQYTLYENEIYYLPDNIREQLDLKLRTGELIGIGVLIDGDHYTSLINMNDRGCTFNQIADVIEKHWEQL